MFVHSTNKYRDPILRQTVKIVLSLLSFGFNATLSPCLSLLTFLGSSKLVICEELMTMYARSVIQELKSFCYIQPVIFLLERRE